MGDMVFIKGNFPSFKNSKQRTSKGFMIMSKTVQKYLKEFEHQWEVVPKDFQDLQSEDFPITVGFHFVRGTRHRWDFHNMVQGCSDLMVKHGWIPDDSMDYFIPECLWIAGKHYGYSKDEPMVAIEITKYYNG
jgi:hypothetical protein